MRVTLGTFNLNNLFSRYSFKGEIAAIRSHETGVDSDILYEFGPTDRFRIRTYRGRLVKAKDPEDSQRVTGRILAMDVDVLAVQEVEDIDTLRQFNRDTLGSMYRHLVLVEGNDRRLIDVGVLSKLPIGGVTSWQHAVHTDDPGEPIFSRDLLEVQILNAARSRVLFTIFNNHLKSHFVDYREDAATGEQANTLRRTRQSATVARIVKDRTRPDSRFAIVGDMNDPPGSSALRPFVGENELDLSNGLSSPTETRPAKVDTPPPPGPAWTHRFKPTGQPAEYELYDQIWLSRSLASRQSGAWIDRRTRHGGDGSDHDPAWVELDV